MPSGSLAVSGSQSGPGLVLIQELAGFISLVVVVVVLMGTSVLAARALAECAAMPP